MSKKKSKLKVLSDEEYGQYIMALKDESPDMVLKKTDEDSKTLEKRR